MAAGIGFTGRIGMQMNPRIDTKSLGLFQQELFTIGQ
jgi:hypothetical protein